MIAAYDVVFAQRTLFSKGEEVSAEELQARLKKIGLGDEISIEDRMSDMASRKVLVESLQPAVEPTPAEDADEDAGAEVDEDAAVDSEIDLALTKQSVPDGAPSPKPKGRR